MPPLQRRGILDVLGDSCTWCLVWAAFEGGATGEGGIRGRRYRGGEIGLRKAALDAATTEEGESLRKAALDAATTEGGGCLSSLKGSWYHDTLLGILLHPCELHQHPFFVTSSLLRSIGI